MGLAASQARFLAITSRKANCEFQSMQIAQDKLSVTRDLAEISQNYQNALNQTTLVWDFDGTGAEPYNLSYGLLMTPTMLNNFTPYLLTTRTGSVVLNSQMARAAAAISPDGVPVGRSSAGFATFLAALGANGVISESMAKDIGKQTYNPVAGYGATPLNKNGAETNNVLGLAHELEQTSNMTLDAYFGSGYTLYVNGAAVSEEGKKKLTFSDLLTKDIIAVKILPDGNHGITNEPGKAILNLVDASDATNKRLFSDLTTELKSILGTDPISSDAFNKATIVTRDQYTNITTINNGDKKRSEDEARNSLKNESSERNNVVFFQNKGDKRNSGYAINLTNMVSYLLTQFECIMNGYENYFAGLTSSSSSFVTDDLNYNFVMKNRDAVTDDILLKTDFYMQLYNNICVNGWTENTKIDADDKYLEQMLKNGNFFMTSLSGDGYFYQGRYNESDCIVEVKDSDAIAQAEAEFTTKKAKLTYKEDRLDMEMKNLDAEISALTTEYDSVKGLISKNVEKIFQMFQ